MIYRNIKFSYSNNINIAPITITAKTSRTANDLITLDERKQTKRREGHHEATGKDVES